MKRSAVWIALACACAAAPALANDSSAELRQGGIVLTRNAGVQMRSEDLYISEKTVKVRYHFLNTTGRDQTVLVAFPMPDIVVEGIDDNLAIPTENPENILGFKVTVDGRPVQTRVEQKALSHGVDRTAYLKRLGLPIAPHLRSTYEAMDHVSPKVRAELLRLGLAVPDDFDAGKGWEHHLQPTWTLKTTYYWEQLFPAGREIEVAHEYTPSVGGTSGTSLEADWFRTSADYKLVARKYCVDETFLAAVDRRKKQVGPNAQAFFEKRIDYVLKTGANWAAPIGDFRLVIDKGDPSALVSFCEDGVKKLDATRFEVRHHNFRPTRDLSILILEPVPAQ